MKVAWALLLVACAGTTQYTPRVTAAGELTATYDGGFRLWSQGKIVAGGYSWSGLSHFVRCVPRAEKMAAKAERSGALAIGLSIAGGIVGGASLASIPAYAVTRDTVASTAFLLGGAGAAILGAVMAGLGRGYKNAANGQAIDAMNYYNDAVGSYGASCDQPEP